MDNIPFNALGHVVSGVGKLAWGATSLVGGLAWKMTSLAYVHGLKGQLMDAARNGQHGRVCVLILLGADVDMTDEHGRTALWIAASLGHKEVVERLVQHAQEGKCSVDSEDKCARTPLWIAVSNGHKDVARLLLQHSGVGIPDIPNIWDSRDPRHTTSRMINKKDKDGNNPLKMACLKDNLPMVHLLCEWGADIHSKDKDGNNPLKMACLKDNLPMVQLLCEWGADLHSKDKDGVPPLALATKLRYHKVADYLKVKLLQKLQDETQKHSQYLTVLSKEYQEVERWLKAYVSERDQKVQLIESFKENIKETLWKASLAVGMLEQMYQAQLGLQYEAYNCLASEINVLIQLCTDKYCDLLQNQDRQNQLLDELRTTEKMVQWQLAEAQKYKVQHGGGFQSKASASAPGANSRPAPATRGTAPQSAGASTSSAGPKSSKTVAAELELDRILNCASDHECLKLKPGASAQQVRQSYKRMAVTLHPDKCSLPGAKEAFQRLNAAYEKLIH